MDNEKIIMRSKKIMIAKINKKTRAQMFKELKEGNLIVFELSLKGSGIGSSGRSYASYIKITNLETNEFTYKSLNELGYILNAFELEEVGE